MGKKAFKKSPTSSARTPISAHDIISLLIKDIREFFISKGASNSIMNSATPKLKYIDNGNIITLSPEQTKNLLREYPYVRDTYQTIYELTQFATNKNSAGPFSCEQMRRLRNELDKIEDNPEQYRIDPERPVALKAQPTISKKPRSTPNPYEFSVTINFRRKKPQPLPEPFEYPNNNYKLM